MTFWQLSVSFKAHLAHLPSPVMVTFPLASSAAKVGVASASARNAATPENRTNAFFIRFVCDLMGHEFDMNKANFVQKRRKRNQIPSQFFRLAIVADEAPS